MKEIKTWLRGKIEQERWEFIAGLMVDALLVAFVTVLVMA